MEIFDTIHAQQGAMRMPLVAVTLTAAARVGSPVLLMLHWHGFYRETPLDLPQAGYARRSVPGSAIQLDDRWDAFPEVDRAALDAAWQLGAWDVERVVHRPYWRLGATDSEALACRRAFGDYPDLDPGQEAVVLAAPDREEMMRLAARRGFVRWLFRPRKGGLWDSVADEDDTLDAQGGRALPCPVAPRPYAVDPPSRTVYRLGRVEHIILP